ncbi:phosphotransferase family protein [Dyella monticola]|uniref:phosphotransferase family protein n=1 Tax=Dyella monticola TaxID=1927958 RepID=UPI0013143006|nr:phosphotransferase [Dyella monticola]
MILTRHNTLLFLLNHRLISAQDLVEHALIVRSHTQRNRGFSVTWHNGQGYYVKQHQPDAGPWESHSSVVNEARILQALQRGGSSPTPIPALRLFDAQRQALVMDWQPDAVPCADLAIVDGQIDPTVAAMLGTALAGLHAYLASAGHTDSHGQAFSNDPPWVLQFHRLHPLAGEDQSWAQARLVALIGQQEDILPALAALAANWPIGQLIHGDMKWQNCLMRAATDGATNCVFIDWEMAALGDPLWDLAGLAQSWLKTWLDGVPVDAVDSQQDLASRGAASFAPFQQALSALWQAYLAERPGVSRTHFVALCGARLIQTLYEENDGEINLLPAHLMLLQLARNLLLQPEEGATYLLEPHGRPSRSHPPLVDAPRRSVRKPALR